MIKIYTSYFSKIHTIVREKRNPCLINIAKFVPPPMLKHLHGSINEFKPTVNLLNKYKMGKVTEEEYKEIYLKDVEKNLIDTNIIELLSRDEKVYSSVVLLCYEKSENFCHRHILRDYLNNLCNLGIEEY